MTLSGFILITTLLAAALVWIGAVYLAFLFCSALLARAQGNSVARGGDADE